MKQHVDSILAKYKRKKRKNPELCVCVCVRVCVCAQCCALEQRALEIIHCPRVCEFTKALQGALLHGGLIRTFLEDLCTGMHC